jgi:hypothetical protein
MDDSLQPINLAAPYYDTAPGEPVPKISVRHLNFFYGQTQALFDNNLDIAEHKVRPSSAPPAAANPPTCASITGSTSSTRITMPRGRCR